MHWQALEPIYRYRPQPTLCGVHLERALDTHFHRPSGRRAGAARALHSASRSALQRLRLQGLVQRGPHGTDTASKLFGFFFFFLIPAKEHSVAEGRKYEEAYLDASTDWQDAAKEKEDTITAEW